MQRRPHPDLHTFTTSCARRVGRNQSRSRCPMAPLGNHGSDPHRGSRAKTRRNRADSVATRFTQGVMPNRAGAASSPLDRVAAG